MIEYTNHKLKARPAETVSDNSPAPRKGDEPLPHSGIAWKLAQETERAKVIAKRLKMPFADPLTSRIEPAAVALINQETARRLQVLPVRIVDNTLLVAMASPEKTVLKTLEVLTACEIRLAVAPPTSLSVVLDRVYKKNEACDAAPAKNRPSKTETVATKNDAQEAGAQTVSIISNKGGVGKTHVAINLACAMARRGSRVLLLDADLGNADISNKLGIFPDRHLLDFLEKDRELQDLIVASSHGFDLICGTYGEFKLANLNHAQKTRFINHFKKISRRYDYAIFDLGAGIARTVLDFALGADRTVIVATPQDLISGYACAKAAFSRFKELEERLEEKVSGYRPRWTFAPIVIMNQVGSIEQGFKLFENLVKTTNENINSCEDRFRIELQYLGGIEYDKESLRAAESKKRPLLLQLPYIKASQCIDHMATQMFHPDKDFDPRVKFGHSFKRFMAILSKNL